MITRRSVRIKAMQAIYACEATDQGTITQFEKNLQDSILSVKQQYLYILLYIRETANFVEHDAKVKASKFIKSDADRNFNTKLLSNALIQYLNNDKEFLDELKKAGVKSMIDEDIVRNLYKTLTESPVYKLYLTNGKEFDVAEDRRIIQYLFEDILLQDERFLHQTEECFLNWDDDAALVVDAVREVIEKSKHELKLHLEKERVREKLQELSEFGQQLFRQTITHKSDYAALIEPKLKNWDADRLAVLDVILLRMALAEFLEFPSIPTKVTINEYLDIAKEYSTPKSKDFINGVLDSIMHDLKAQDKIKKTGRGLL